MKQKPDVIVVGSGAIGMLSALYLDRAGLSVSIVERQQPAQESSWAGGGILSPLYPWRYPDPVTRLASWSQSNYPELAQTLKDGTGIDPEWTQSGLLLPDLGDETGMALAWANRFEHRAEVLDRTATHDTEPALGDNFHSSLWMPDIAQVRNPRLNRSLYNFLASRKIEVVTDSAVTELLIRNDSISGVRTPNGDFEASNVVICTGAWTRELLSTFTPRPEIFPVKGQMMLFKAPENMLRRIVLHGDRYAIPRRDGHVLFGSTLEHTEYEKQVTAVAAEDLLQAATALIPALGECPVVKQWAGLRPGTEDGVPYICGHPEIKGLYINAGQYRNGLVLGPASAQLLSNLVAGETPIVDPAPYRLSR